MERVKTGVKDVSGTEICVGDIIITAIGHEVAILQGDYLSFELEEQGMEDHHATGFYFNNPSEYKESFGPPAEGYHYKIVGNIDDIPEIPL